GLLFFNTLFDENAACHIALGQCYSKCFVDGDRLTPEQIVAQGGNKSFIHIDWMIGSDKLDIDGVHSDGRRVPVFRKGEWAGAADRGITFQMLEKFERYPLTFGPTPIEKLARLGAHLGGKVELYAKREDCNSGLAFGG